MKQDTAGNWVPDMPYGCRHHIGPGCPHCQPRHYVFGSPVPSPARSPIPSIAEQMGCDPVSKLAAAIHDLADALRSMNGDGGSAG